MNYKRSAVHITEKMLEQMEELLLKWDGEGVRGLVDLDGNIMVSPFIRYSIDRLYHHEIEDKNRRADPAEM